MAKKGIFVIMKIRESLEFLLAIIKNPELLKISRLKASAFTRNRSMGFSDALCFMLDMRKTTIQTRLNMFFRHVKGGTPISQPAFTKLRSQFSHKPFEVMMRELVKEEYSGKYETPLWNGYVALAVDGSYLQLPTTPELAVEFGVRGAGNRPSAGISVLYDVLHGWVLDAEIDGTDRNERHALARHIDFLKRDLPHVAKKTLLLADRGYPSYELLEKCEENGLKYVMRCSSQSFRFANDAPLGDVCATLENGRIVRVVKFTLNSGEVETLVTNLFDVPENEFPELYAMRWGIETLYHELKRKVGVEKFSGKTPNSVRQDFWASLVLLLQIAVFQKEADAMVAERRKANPRKRQYRARTSDLIVILRDRFIFAALCDIPVLKQIELNDVLRELSRAVSPVRPGRSFPRVPKPCAAANPFLKSAL